MPGTVLDVWDTAVHETNSLSSRLCILMGRDRTLNKQGSVWGYNCYRGNKQDEVTKMEGHLSCNLKDEHKPAMGCV